MVMDCRVVLAMGLYYYGLQSTSAAYSAIFLNLIPIVTFIIAIILRYYIYTAWMDQNHCNGIDL